jgi:uncharacterized membrane-anchored protein
MNNRRQAGAPLVASRRVWNKTPEITVWFWVVLVIAATVDDAATYLMTVKGHLGLPIATLASLGLLAIALLIQFAGRRYTATRYWTTVVAVNITGTLLAADLARGAGLALLKTSLLFAVLLGVVLGVWYAVERTCSIHTVVTPRREAFYWSAMLLAGGLGTAVGDGLAWRVGLGFAPTAAVAAAVISLVVLSYRGGLLGTALAFWAGCALTQPLGASVRDFLTQAPEHGGLGLQAVHPTALVLLAGWVLMVFLARTGRDRPRLSDDEFVRSAPPDNAAAS